MNGINETSVFLLDRYFFFFLLLRDVVSSFVAFVEGELRERFGNRFLVCTGVIERVFCFWNSTRFLLQRTFGFCLDVGESLVVR